MKAVIHIGAEKTGTTTIQEFCTRNRATFANHGVLYPASLGSPNHVKLAAYALADGKIDDIRRDLGLLEISQVVAFRQRLGQELSEEIARSGDIDTLLISNEHLQSRLLQLSEVQRLRDFIAGMADELKIVVYLRRQDRLAVSYYSTKLKAGSVNENEIFPSLTGDEALPPYYDYDSMLKRYEEIFGLDNIILRIFEPDMLIGRDLLVDFRAVCGLPQAADFVEVPRRNESLSAVGIEFFRRFNEVVPRFVNGRPNPRRSEISLTVMKEFHGRGPQASKVEAERFYERFKQSNAAINTRYFPQSTRELFDADFTSYGASPAEPAGRGELVDLAIHLWLDRSAKLEEARLTAFLPAFELAVKRKGGGELPNVPELADDAVVSMPILLKVVGALVVREEYSRASDLAGRVLQGGRGRWALAIACGFALLRAGATEAFDAFVEKYGSYRRVVGSLTAMKMAGLETLNLEESLEYLRNGDAIQSEFHAKCIAWLNR